MGNIFEEINEGIAWDLGFRNDIKLSAYYSNNFTSLHGDIVYVIFQGQMVVNQNT